jgi:hypothetical protein
VEGFVKNDVTYVAILVGFFLLSVLFVFACDRIIGRDEADLDQSVTGEPEPQDERLAA